MEKVVLGIMDQCDSKIDCVNICGSVTYISWSIDFALYHCHRLKIFLYIKKWCQPGVFGPLQALAVVYCGSRDFIGLLCICNTLEQCAMSPSFLH